MGVSSSSSNGLDNDKFIKIGEEYIGMDEKTFSSGSIYQFRFLKPKVTDRVIVQLRAEVKVGNLTWTILRSLEDVRQLRESLNLPVEFLVTFPKIDHRYFSEDSEILMIHEMVSKWLIAAAEVSIHQPPMLRFLGVMDPQISETAATEIDIDTLIRTCDTGDILLFRNKGLISTSIRKITSAKYDHVGVVIVNKSDSGGREECFLEASGDRYGVNIHNLRRRLHEWYLADARICYRRLRCRRDKIFQIRTTNFIEQVQGLKYGFNIKSLMLNTKDQQPTNKRKFFCSELVTAFYKHLGFIKSYAKSHNYMPGDFAEKECGSRLNLVDAILEHEISVKKWPTPKPARITSIVEDITKDGLHLRNCLSHNCLGGTRPVRKSSRKHGRKRSLSLGDIRIDARVSILSQESLDNRQDDRKYTPKFEEEKVNRNILRHAHCD